MHLPFRARPAATAAVTVAAGLAALAAPLAGAAPPAGAAPAAEPARAEQGTRSTLGAVADDYASRGVSRGRGARARRLRIDARPRAVAHLRFDLRRLAGRRVTGAVLRVYPLGTSRPGFVVRARRGPAARSGRVRRGRWTRVDVRRLVAGSGPLRLTLATRSRRGLAIASREVRRRRPRLVVTSTARAKPPAKPPVTPPAPPPPRRPAGAVRVAAVGDIHPPSASSTSAATAAEAAKADLILGLGDYQYQSGTMADFNAYFDKDWGPLVRKMYPVLAPTHDQDWRAADPLRYFNGGGAHGYRSPVTLKPLTPYSFDRGAWHVVVLPDACARVRGCDLAAITAWLKADLERHRTRCTVAAWHQPYFASSTEQHDPFDAVRPWVDLLYAHRVDVVLTGHQHAYERFAPQDAARRADPRGPQAFVVGTGGIGLYPFTSTAPNSVTRQASTYGVLNLTLRDGSYDWRFVPVAGGTYTDRGTLTCR